MRSELRFTQGPTPRFHRLLPPTGDGAGRCCGAEPHTAGGGLCPPAGFHTAAGAAAVAVAGPRPRADGHPGGHAAATPAGHATAGTHTHILPLTSPKLRSAYGVCARVQPFCSSLGSM